MGVSGSGNYSIVLGTAINVGTPYTGGAGYGQATIDGTGGGFDQTIQSFNVGTGGGNSGVLTMNGALGTASATITDGMMGTGFSGALRVGINGGTGTVLVQAGARIESVNSGFYDSATMNSSGGYYNVNIGRGGGSVGTITVDGAGSFLGAYGEVAPRINVGRQDGTGTLNVQNDGDVGSFGLLVGRGGTGTVNVDGAGSTITLSDQYGRYSQYQGNDYTGDTGGITVGRDNGVGSLNITGGGVVDLFNTAGITDSPFVNIGRNLESQGTVLVSGAGSEFNVTQNGVNPAADSDNPYLAVGRSGQGTLTVESGGTVNVTGNDARLVLADVHGSETALTSAQNLLEIRSGGVVNVDSAGSGNAGVEVGRDAFGNGRLTIDGAGSQLNITSDADSPNEDSAFLTIGFDGNGVLDVTNGGQIDINANGGLFPSFQIGRGQEDGSVQANGVVTVDGVGSSITLTGTNTSEASSSGFIGVGRRENAEGSLSITNGGSVANTGANAGSYVASRDGAVGSILVDGAGSIFDAGTVLTIGAGFDEPTPGNFVVNPATGGQGSLTVSNGATLTADDITIGESGYIDLGSTANGNIELYGRMDIEGDAVGSATINGDFSLERAGQLLLDITDFAGGVGDVMMISGMGDFDTRRGFIAVEIEAGNSISIGDTYTVATATGGVTALTRTVYDINSGLALELSQSGQNLILTALEGNGIVGTPGNDNPLNGTAGNDTIDGLAGNDTINGLGGNDILIGGLGMDALNGGSGIDTASYANSAAGVMINLSAGTGLGGEAQGDTLTQIENVTGSNLADTLIGDGAANTLQGLGGNDFLNASGAGDILEGGNDDDTLLGGAGADVLNGGAGTDTASYSNSSSAVTVNLGTGAASGGDAAGDTLMDIENLLGSAFADALTGSVVDNTLDGFNGNDTLTGGGGTNTLNGGNGDDTFIGGAGTDFFSGGSGSDTIDYSASAAGVTVGVNAGGTFSGGDADGDSHFGVESLTGSAMNDSLTGNSLRNTMMGGDGADFVNAGDNIDTIDGGNGDDTIIGGRGADIINGGLGLDTASYSNSDLRITVDLMAGTAVGSGHGAGDALTSIENVFGSRFNDDITGTGAANSLNGFLGNDTINAGGGADTLFGGSGSDSLNGGAGSDTLVGGMDADTFVFDALVFGMDTITDFQNGSDMLDFTAAGLDFTDFTRSQVGANTVLTLNANANQTLTLNNINESLIDAGDFL